MFYIASGPYIPTHPHIDTMQNDPMAKCWNVTHNSIRFVCCLCARHSFDVFIFLLPTLALFVNDYILSINNPLMVWLFNAWRLQITTYMLRCFVSEQTHTYKTYSFFSLFDFFFRSFFFTSHSFTLTSSAFRLVHLPSSIDTYEWQLANEHNSK